MFTNVIILKSFNLWYWLTNACRKKQRNEGIKNAKEDEKQTGEETNIPIIKWVETTYRITTTANKTLMVWTEKKNKSVAFLSLYICNHIKHQRGT